MKKNLLLLFLSGLFFAGCGTDYEILNSYESIILTADSSVKKFGETITFTVRNGQGDNLTEDTVFYVDGVEIEGNTFSSDEVGSHIVTATYFDVESAPLQISFHDGTIINFRKKVLIEDYTGTWCGYCPRVAYAIELVKAQTEDAIAVAIHRPTNDPASLVYDPYNFAEAEALELFLGGEGGYPKGYLNRINRWTSLEPEHVNEAIALTQGENPRLGLAMTAAVAEGNISLDVNVMFGKEFTNELKLVVYVLENGLLYEQHNYTSYYDGVDLLEGFEHNHTLRATLTPILGEAISSSETTFENVYTRTFSVPVPANMENAGNIEFVAFIVDETGRAVNVRAAHAGEDQEFELL
jgi:thiol-disulfide isomerase/thioredoxin